MFPITQYAMSKVLFGRSGSLCGLRGPLLASAGSGRSKPRENKTLVQVQSDTYLCRSILSEPFLAILLFFSRLLDQADRVLAYLRGPVFTSPTSKRAVNRSYPSCTRIRYHRLLRPPIFGPFPRRYTPIMRAENLYSTEETTRIIVLRRV